ncbi:MAG: MarR family transcriptional regulator [Desulfomonile tiedjei]|nr:MarR family transcriptional regulator [Desulfomonile tiedjei]
MRYHECIVFLLAKAYQKAHGNLKRKVVPFGLTPVQVLVVEALRDEEGVSAGEMGRKLMLDSATLSGVLDRLVEKGWIIKETDSADKRSLRIYLGSKARDLNEFIAVEREKANEEILGELSLEEQVLLKRLLRHISG